MPLGIRFLCTLKTLKHLTMPRKKRLVPHAPANDQAFILGSAPINDEMYKIITYIKNYRAGGDKTGDVLGEAVRQLLHSSLEQINEQQKPPRHNTQHT